MTFDGAISAKSQVLKEMRTIVELLLRRLSERGSPQSSNSDEAQSTIASCGENMRQSAEAPGGIGYTVVKNHNRPWDEILFNQPLDVPDRRMHWVVRIGTTQNAFIPLLARET